MPSTVIQTFAYHPHAAELEVTFTTGRRYVYHRVPPEAADRLKAAFSKGRYFNSRIRGRYHFTELSD